MTKRKEQLSRELAENKVKELSIELESELNAIFPEHHPEKHLQEQRIFLLSVQVHALKANINFKNQ